MADSSFPIGLKFLSLTSWGCVYRFHEATGSTINQWPPTFKDAVLRVHLIREELEELEAALANEDLIEVADALADLDYVVNGAAVAFGIVLPVVTAEVHRSNMTKLGPDGTALRREDGKVTKGPNFEPPKIANVLDNGGRL